MADTKTIKEAYERNLKPSKIHPRLYEKPIGITETATGEITAKGKLSRKYVITEPW